MDGRGSPVLFSPVLFLDHPRIFNLGLPETENPCFFFVISIVSCSKKQGLEGQGKSQTYDSNGVADLDGVTEHALATCVHSLPLKFPPPHPRHKPFVLDTPKLWVLPWECFEA